MDIYIDQDETVQVKYNPTEKDIFELIKSPKQRLETYCFCSVSYYYYYYY
jgi:hypothetical protein